MIYQLEDPRGSDILLPVEFLGVPCVRCNTTRFHKYLSVFKKKELERLPLCKPWDHTIKTKLGFPLKKSKVYALSPKEQEEVDDFINEQLRKGYIQPSKSPQASPIFFVPKKDHKKECAQIIII